MAGYGELIEPAKSRRTFEEVSDRLKELILNGTLQGIDFSIISRIP